MRKGLDVTAAALSELAEAGMEFGWVVVGQRHSSKPESIEYERRLIETSKQSSLAGRVHFLGRRTDVCRIMNEATALIHAARQEPLGRVIIEAAACGLPIIATDVGGTTEIVSADQEGLVVPPNDKDQLKNAIDNFLNCADLRANLAAAARDRAVRYFDCQISANALVQLYSEML